MVMESIKLIQFYIFLFNYNVLLKALKWEYNTKLWVLFYKNYGNKMIASCPFG